MFSKIILASQSPRRQQLLTWAEIPFDVKVSNSDETFPPQLEPAEIAMYIAENKVKAVLDGEFSDVAVLGADTLVVCNDLIFGKPSNEVEAIKMLTLLSGNSHEVITGVCIKKGTDTLLFYDVTKVHFHQLKPSQISFYVHTYKPYDKAGGYAIQEWIGVVGIKSIEGDFYNVMGLPVSRVVQALKRMEGKMK